ncbi:MAG TPA: hypothetical protein VN784_17455 [Candidatus Limnocylindrales bacterium]|nr:hypothetical protein [Candidatus Limnocylindrales bacterium]
MNLTVQTPDEWLAALAKPGFETVTQYVMAPNDWLIVCAGFEDRALAVLQNAVSLRRPFNVLLIHYGPHFQENKSNIIRKIIQDAGINVLEVTYNRQEPAGFGSTMLEKLSGCQGRIFVDVSAMSRLLIVQALVALGTRSAGFANCFVAYAEAREYPPSQGEAEAELTKSESDPCLSILFLSSGVFDVTVVPELSSFAPTGTQTRLVAFPSLDAHHLIAIRNEIQPSRFSFIEGVPPSSQNKWRQRVISAINKLDKIPDAERFQTSTLDYRETLDCLLTLYAGHGERERLLVSPTGSKMQTVAVGIFRALIEDVQIVFPTPLSYLKPDGYTRGIGPLHLLPLAPLAFPKAQC